MLHALFLSKNKQLSVPHYTNAESQSLNIATSAGIIDYLNFLDSHIVVYAHNCMTGSYVENSL